MKKVSLSGLLSSAEDASVLEKLTGDQISLLEELSDKTRQGTPISFLDAIAVANYQTLLIEKRSKKWDWLKFWKKRSKS